MAKSSALPKGQALSNQEMIALIDQLFACENPYNCPNGKKCFITFELEDISKRF
jgi:DNA mismatch repair protein MutL